MRGPGITDEKKTGMLKISIQQNRDGKVNLDGGDLADENEGHHDAKAKAKAAEPSSTSKWRERLAEKKHCYSPLGEHLMQYLK